MNTSRTAIPFLAAWLAFLAVHVGLPARGENIDPENDGSQYAYGENVGWLSAEQDTDSDGVPDQGVTVTDDGLAGWIWGENVGWISLSCENTSSCATVDYGVDNDGCGTLTGRAWGENIGWVSFSHVQGGVFIDPLTGEFGGEAWAENVGWIRFASSGTVPYGVKTGWVRLPPTGSPALGLEHLHPVTTVSWPAVTGADAYDVVQGDLGALRASGDLGAATAGCLAEDTGSTSATHTATPAPGTGIWFLSRGVNCGGNGSYDSGGPGQHHPRDIEIEGSPGACM